MCMCVYVYMYMPDTIGDSSFNKSSGLGQVEGCVRSAHASVCHKVKEVTDPFIEHMWEVEI